MKSSKRCPKCECEFIAHLPKITQSTEFQHARFGTAMSEILKVEAYVCSNCHYMETYLAMSLEELKNEGILFSWLRFPPDAEGTPYR